MDQALVRIGNSSSSAPQRIEVQAFSDGRVWLEGIYLIKSRRKKRSAIFRRRLIIEFMMSRVH